jgi:uncharacterized membrane protein
MDNLFVKTFLDVLHVLATVIWIGGMLVNFLVIRPTTAKVLEPAVAGKFTQALMKRFRIFVYASIVILGITGIPMNIVSEHYESIIYFENTWGIISFIKHLLYGLLVILAVLNFEVIGPRLAGAASGGDQVQAAKWSKSLAMSGMVAMASAIGTLILSSMMRYL